jgi:hypothetical protein
LTRNYKGWNLIKSNVLYTIGKPFKCRYLKWFCIFNLRIPAKSYDEKKCRGSNFPFSPWEIVAPYGKFDPGFSFHHNF